MINAHPLMGVYIFGRWYDFFIATNKLSNMIFIENAVYSEDDIMTLHALQGGGDEDLDEDDDLEDDDLDVDDDLEDDDLEDDEDEESIIDAGEGSDGGSASDGGD